MLNLFVRGSIVGSPYWTLLLSIKILNRIPREHMSAVQTQLSLWSHKDLVIIPDLPQDSLRDMVVLPDHQAHVDWMSKLIYRYSPLVLLSNSPPGHWSIDPGDYRSSGPLVQKTMNKLSQRV